MTLHTAIITRQDEFIRLCRSHNVQNLYAFGSAVTDHFDEANSDIDLLVEVDVPNPVTRGETLLSLWDGLETFFERRVDLLTGSSLRNPFLKASVDETQKLIYDREWEKVPG